MDISYDLNGWLWTATGLWRAVATPSYRLDVLAGARMLKIDQTMSWQLAGNIGSVSLPDRAGSRSASLQNWDAIVGVKGRATFGEDGRWSSPYYLNIGFGESKFA